MSAVAAPSQQPAILPSASTPGFFSSAFLELNVFDQCFSSLTGESTTSDQKMNSHADSMASPKSIPLGRQNSGSEYHASLGLGLSNPVLQEKRHSLHLPQSPIPSYEAERRFSLPVGPHGFDTSLPAIDQFQNDRRWSHHQTSHPSFSRSSPAWMTASEHDQPYSRHKPDISPSLQSITIPHPTPPSSTHSNSPANNFNSDGGLQTTMTPIDSLSPLDTLITDNTTEIHGQYTPPSDSPAVQNPTYFNSSSSGNDPSLPPPSQKNARAKRGSTKSGSSGSRRPKRNGEGSAAEQEENANDVKRRRFLERNRVAASKCRLKKKQWMQELETNARKAQSDSKHLHGMVGILREELLRLKGELLKHSSCGCEQISTYLLNEAAKVAEGAHRSMTALQQSANQVTVAQIQYSNRSEGSEQFDDDDMIDMEDDDGELHEPPSGGGSEPSG